MSVCVLGSINLDIVCRVAELPAPGETVSALSIRRFPGGKGANQAVASAHWGAATTLIGAVGADEAAEGLLAHLAEAGLDISRIARIKGEPTGQAFICVSTAGENMIVVVGGANRAITPGHVDFQNLTGHRVFLSQFETPPAAIEALFATGAARSGVKILNAAPAEPDGQALFALADVLIVNQTELARYAGEGEPTLAARRLIARPGQSVVVTLGAGGAMAVDARSTLLVEGRSARVVDTTGAGDCFCGVFAANLDEGAGLATAMRRANAAAAASTQTLGAAVSPNLRAEADALG